MDRKQHLILNHNTKTTRPITLHHPSFIRPSPYSLIMLQLRWMREITSHHEYAFIRTLVEHILIGSGVDWSRRTSQLHVESQFVIADNVLMNIQRVRINWLNDYLLLLLTSIISIMQINYTSTQIGTIASVRQNLWWWAINFVATFG